MGPLIARARAAGYRPGTPHPRPRPYNGYYFHILTQQGPNAPGGAKDYVVDGRMTGGFALIAYPATHGDSGIMTFIVNQDGIVYQKNLGPDTPRIAAAVSYTHLDVYKRQVIIAAHPTRAFIPTSKRFLSMIIRVPDYPSMRR